MQRQPSTCIDTSRTRVCTLHIRSLMTFRDDLASTKRKLIRECTFYESTALQATSVPFGRPRRACLEKAYLKRERERERGGGWNYWNAKLLEGHEREKDKREAVENSLKRSSDSHKKNITRLSVTPPRSLDCFICYAENFRIPS